MKTQKFNISTREATTRISSTLQHKLRIVMKCYTIKDFNINDSDNNFEFKKTNRVRGIVVLDKKQYSGSYEIIENEMPLDDKEFKLIIHID